MNAIQPTVAQFMTDEPIGADKGLSLADANERMYINNIRHLVVVDGNHVVGVLSTRDVALALSMAKEPGKLTVFHAMVREPYTCSPGTPLAEVAQEMEKHRYGCAIVSEGDELVGVFTTTDALRAVRALIAGRSVEPAAKPNATPHHTEHAERKIRIGKLKPIEGTYFLGHRVG
jgi:acetoin utilization protein AcuB